MMKVTLRREVVHSETRKVDLVFSRDVLVILENLASVGFQNIHAQSYQFSSDHSKRHGKIDLFNIILILISNSVSAISQIP